ncbi:MAG TPA: tetratricopeptide repeat protein [Cytophagales bacterium]|nr:tetratricopeptide repeat protein [Cytophagales bacterium]
MDTRLKKLLEFYNEDPDDPFTIYAIALEYLASNKEEAKKYFEILLEKHPDYIGTYYHAAQLYIDLEFNDKAKETFEKGIALSEKKNDQHALKELKSAYQNFLFENM